MKSITCLAKDLPVAVLNLVQDDFTYEPYEQTVSAMTPTEVLAWTEPALPEPKGCPSWCNDPSHNL